MQKVLNRIEYIENIEIETPVYGGKCDDTPYIWEVGFNFESAGCAFESHRGCFEYGGLDPGRFLPGQVLDTGN